MIKNPFFQTPENKNKRISLISRFQKFDSIARYKSSLFFPVVVSPKNSNSPSADQQYRYQLHFPKTGKNAKNEFINCKREILISKINQLNQKEQMQKINKLVNDEEKLNKQNEESFKINIRLIRSKTVENMQSVQSLYEKMSNSQMHNKHLDIKLDLMKRQIANKETQIRISNENIEQLNSYASFINMVKTINKSSNIESSDEAFLIYFKKNEKRISGQNNFFVTSQEHLNEEVLEAKSIFDYKSDSFYTILNQIEEENFLMFEANQSSENEFEQNQQKMIQKLKNSKITCSLFQKNLNHLLIEENNLQFLLKTKENSIKFYENKKQKNFKEEESLFVRKFTQSSKIIHNSKKSYQEVDSDMDLELFQKIALQILSPMEIKQIFLGSPIDCFKLLALIFELYSIQCLVIEQNLSSLYLYLRKNFKLLTNKNCFKVNGKNANYALKCTGNHLSNYNSKGKKNSDFRLCLPRKMLKINKSVIEKQRFDSDDVLRKKQSF